MGRNVAVVDYGLGNLFSIRHACGRVGLNADIVSDPEAMMSADALILPGMGAFGDAMSALRMRGQIDAIRAFAESGKPVVGICLGMQLLFCESEEFGKHEGLGLIDGDVVQLAPINASSYESKVPQVGWNGIFPPPINPDRWGGTLLDRLPAGMYQYFVHSFVVRPSQAEAVLAVTNYGNVEFCSAVHAGNVHGFQFHPERSGSDGLQIYQALAQQLPA